jgi:hypothetical protein
MRITALIVSGLSVAALAAVPPQGRGGIVAGPPQSAVVEGTGAISGVVTDGVTGRPMAGALVDLGGGLGFGIPVRAQQMTDAQGRYVFTRLPPNANYLIRVTDHGYLEGGYQRLPGSNAGPRVILRDGEWLSRVDVLMWKPGVITGTVRDDRGDPLVGIPIQAMLRVMVRGRARWVSGPVAVTDDRGAYRLADLGPGDYLIHAPSVQITLPSGAAALRSVSFSTVPNAAANRPPASAIARTSGGPGLLLGHYATPPAGTGARAYASTYYPSAESADVATPVTVAFNDRRIGVDITMGLRSTVRIAGQVTGTASVGAGLPVRLMRRGNEGLGTAAASGLTVTDDQGRFVFLNVPEGDYTVIASREIQAYTSTRISSIQSALLLPTGGDPFSGGLTNSQVYGSPDVRYSTRHSQTGAGFGRVAVSIGSRDVEDLHVPLTPGVTVSGRYVFEGAAKDPAVRDIAPPIMLEPVDEALGLGRPEFSFAERTGAAPNTTFTINNVIPGRYSFGVLHSTAWTPVGVEYEGRDVLGRTFEVGDQGAANVVLRLSSNGATLGGFVRNASSALADEGYVIVFPADRQWSDVGPSALRFYHAPVLQDGTYRFSAMVPGEYFVAVIALEDRARWLTPAYLDRVSAMALRVTLAPGTNPARDLRAAERRR